jgi:cardiolipin synthase
LLAAGGEVRWFNPLLHRGFAFRDHRKILVCDEEIAFIGGFNVAASYRGDGVKSGWCDLGLEIISPVAVQLAAAFDEMFAHAGPEHRRFRRLPRSSTKRSVTIEQGQLLLSGPGWGRNPFVGAMLKDLAGARDVQIISAYFLPTLRIRRELAKVVRRGGRVQLMLAGKSDVYISQLACRSLYRRLLKAGIEIYEYQPQILHAKLVVIDNSVYAGSSNLDPRSLHINYELMLRLADRKITAGARELFGRKLEFCARIEAEAWKKSRTWWRRMKHRWAYFLLARVDPVFAWWGYRRTRH